MRQTLPCHTLQLISARQHILCMFSRSEALFVERSLYKKANVVMRISSLFASGSALLLASSVTMGSMYVTLNAASSNNAAKAAEALTRGSGAVENQQSGPLTDNVLLTETAGMRQSVAEERRSVDVVIAADGSLTGRLHRFGSEGDESVPVETTTIQIVKNQTTVATATTDAEGIFVVQNLAPGTYSVVADSANGYAVFGIRAVFDTSHVTKADSATPVVRSISELELDVAAVQPMDIEKAKELIAENYKYSEVSDNGQFTEYSKISSGARATTSSSHSVAISEEGTLSGTMLALDPETSQPMDINDLTIYCIRNQQVVGSAPVSVSGVFEISGLSTGAYSIVAAGADGVLAMGVHLVGSDAEDNLNAEYKPVSKRLNLQFAANLAQGVQPSTLGLPGAPGGASGTNPPAAAPGAGAPGPGAGAPGPGGGAPGGTGSGGGGFSGGAGGGAGLGGAGGLGGLLAGAALGGALYAVGKNENNDPVSN